MRIVVVYSGGLDSTTLLYHLREQGHEVKALSADYGQRHRSQESLAAEEICRRLKIERQIVDLTSLVTFFGRNSLSDISVAVPDGRYDEETMQLSTVPNRNMVLLSVGIA